MKASPVQPPSPEPPHGTDCEAYRLWAAEHADDETFAQLYAPRKERILHPRKRRTPRPSESPDSPFMKRLSRL